MAFNKCVSASSAWPKLVTAPMRQKLEKLLGELGLLKSE